jgi:hypothetical protein
MTKAKEMTKEVTKPKLNKQEKGELVRIVKQRFGLLYKQLSGREQELVARFRQEAIEAKAKDISAANKRMNELQKKIDDTLNDFGKEWDKIVEDAREAGLEVPYGGERIRGSVRVNSYGFQPKGLTGDRYSYGEGSKVKGVGTQLRAELQAREGKMIEEIIIGDASEEMRSYLANIPTIDEITEKVVQSVTGAKAELTS